MDTSTRKVVAFCTLGGAAGFVIGSQVGSPWRTMFFASMCSLVFYALFTPRETLAHLRHAGRSTVYALSDSWEDVRRWNVRAMLVTLGWGLSASVWFTAMLGPIGLIPVDGSKLSPLERCVSVEALTWLFCMLNVISGVVRARTGNMKTADEFRQASIHLSPPMLVWHMWRGIRFLVKYAAIFAWKFVVFTYSEARILVASSVFLGAICGVSVRMALLRFHYSMPFSHAVMCGAVIGLVYGMIGGIAIRRRAIAGSGSNVQLV